MTCARKLEQAQNYTNSKCRVAKLTETQKESAKRMNEHKQPVA